MCYVIPQQHLGTAAQPFGADAVMVAAWFLLCAPVLGPAREGQRGRDVHPMPKKPDACDTRGLILPGGGYCFHLLVCLLQADSPFALLSSIFFFFFASSSSCGLEVRLLTVVSTFCKKRVNGLKARFWMFLWGLLLLLLNIIRLCTFPHHHKEFGTLCILTYF